MVSLSNPPDLPNLEFAVKMRLSLPAECWDVKGAFRMIKGAFYAGV